jgi:hypothetical protein
MNPIHNPGLWLWLARRVYCPRVEAVLYGLRWRVKHRTGHDLVLPVLRAWQRPHTWLLQLTAWARQPADLTLTLYRAEVLLRRLEQNRPCG